MLSDILYVLEGYSKFHKTIDSNLSLQIVKDVRICLYVHMFHVFRATMHTTYIQLAYNMYTILCTRTQHAVA